MHDPRDRRSDAICLLRVGWPVEIRSSRGCFFSHFISCDDEDNPSTANLARSVLTVMLHFMDEVCVVLFVAQGQPLYTFCAF